MAEEKVKFLLCVDSSKNAETAFNFYKTYLHQGHQALDIVHVSDFVNISGAMHYIGGAGALDHSTIEHKVNHIKEKNKKLAAEYEKLCTEANIEHTYHTVSGEHGVGHALIEYIKKGGIKGVVLGCRGAGVIRRTFMGSVSDYVLHHSHIPVIVVPH